MITPTQLEQMPIAELRDNLASIMSGVCAAYGDDMPLYLLFRNGRPCKLPWSELDEVEREQQRVAAKRAAYVQNFSPNGEE